MTINCFNCEIIDASNFANLFAVQMQFIVILCNTYCLNGQYGRVVRWTFGVLEVPG